MLPKWSYEDAERLYEGLSGVGNPRGIYWSDERNTKPGGRKSQHVQLTMMFTHADGTLVEFYTNYAYNMGSTGSMLDEIQCYAGVVCSGKASCAVPGVYFQDEATRPQTVEAWIGALRSAAEESKQMYDRMRREEKAVREASGD